MKLMDLLERLEYECVSGSVDAEVNGIANDSEACGRGVSVLLYPGSCC